MQHFLFIELALSAGAYDGFGVLGSSMSVRQRRSPTMRVGGRSARLVGYRGVAEKRSPRPAQHNALALGLVGFEIGNDRPCFGFITTPDVNLSAWAKEHSAFDDLDVGLSH